MVAFVGTPVPRRELPGGGGRVAGGSGLQAAYESGNVQAGSYSHKVAGIISKSFVLSVRASQTVEPGRSATPAQMKVVWCARLKVLQGAWLWDSGCSLCSCPHIAQCIPWWIRKVQARGAVCVRSLPGLEGRYAPSCVLHGK